ncbi:hypothetical protein [Kistimonas asteriae]|uniref:hypothetical protein n=1 Tax=Kistimonas asteriae TaxID=517724 RepID=UPI001BABCA85|nr:hypothetical protein [Kistimonas asteriae]
MNKQEMQDALVSRAASLNEWLSDSSERTIESLMIRKFDCSVVLHGRRLSVESDGGLDVPVQLLIQQDYKLWSINLMLSIKPLDDIDDEDEMRPAGLLFQVVGEEGERHPIVLLRAEVSPAGMDPALDNQQWCHFWLQKFLKQPDIKQLFGYKSLMDEV